MPDSIHGKIVDSTAFVGVYGSLAFYPWINPDEFNADAYGLMKMRSDAMGWATVTGVDVDSASGIPARHSAQGFWEVHEAGTSCGDEDTDLIAWFQLGITHPSQHELPLPMQPLVSCVQDVLTRVGTLALTGIQILLPVHIAGDAYWHLVGTVDLFNLGTRPKVDIDVTLDSGSSDEISAYEFDILNALREFEDHTPSIGVSSGERSSAVTFETNAVFDPWLGNGRHPMTFTVSAPEWSFDVVGWIAELCADACRRAGVGTTILMNARRRIVK